jgi:hypothetical protein
VGTIVSVVTSPVPMSSSSARCMYSEIKVYILTQRRKAAKRHEPADRFKSYLTVSKTSRPSCASLPEKSAAMIRSM